MGFHLCDGADAFTFRDACVRTTWSALVPAAFVLAVCLSSILIPSRVTSAILTPLKTFLTLQEAEALVSATTHEDPVDSTQFKPSRAPVWRTVVLSWTGVLQTLAWFSLGLYRLIHAPEDVWGGLALFLIAFPWLYTAVRPIVSPAATVPYDLFSVYVLQFAAAILQLGGIVYENRVFGIPIPPTIFIAYSTNFVAVLLLILVVLNTPLGVPGARIEKGDIGRSVSPEDYTTLWNWITFSWVYPVIKLGRNTTLKEEDIWELSPTIRSRALFIKFSQIRRNNLFLRLWAANSRDVILDFALTLVGVFFNYAGPLFLKLILDAIESEDAEHRANAYIYACLALFCALMNAQLDLQHLWFGRRAATRVYSELVAAIYEKSLRRKDFSGITKKDALAGKGSDEAEEATSADLGKIVNLMTSDANQLSMVIAAVYMIYGAPLQIIVAATFLYKLLGVAAFAGFFALGAAWPINDYLMKLSVDIYKGESEARDKRMGILSELISAVKFIKYFAWEDRWIQRTLDARQVELDWIRQARNNSAAYTFTWNITPILVSVISFSVFVMQGNQLTVSIAFTAIALFNMIRHPMNEIPSWLVRILQTRVSLNRISAYLNEDEVSEQVSSLKQDRSGPQGAEAIDAGFGFENASFKWNEIEKAEVPAGKKNNSDADTTPVNETAIVSEQSERRFDLRDLSIVFPEGKLTVITGPTASGKTALLMALLGEMTLLQGRLIMRKNVSEIDQNGLAHAISYASQLPWLQHRSIKNNILFGFPYDEERYTAVVEACALKQDFEALEDGDATEIGARGVSLSGGQKARVALARAVYARTKYVLLDDPLSAVDSHTSRFLFDKLFKGPLLADRTVILVTHHVELVLPGAHYLIRMLDGRIDSQGTVNELRADGVLDKITYESAVLAKEEEVAAEAAEENVDRPEDEAKKPRKLITDEHREIGGVKWGIYKTYLKASSYSIYVVLGILVILAEVLGVSEKLWIKIWGEAYGDETKLSAISGTFKRSIISSPQAHMVLPSSSYQLSAAHYLTTRASGTFGINWPDAGESPLFYVGIYGAIGVALTLTKVFTDYAQYTGALRASRTLFKQLLVGVVRATMRWHDTTPQGRMLNRFGKDIQTIDSSIAASLYNVNSSFATFFGALFTVGIVFPSFLLPALILGYIYRELSIGYLRTGRDLRRMESNLRSPIFSDFGELLEGIATVRAFSAEKRFLDSLHVKVDATTKMLYTFWMTNRWLLLNFDSLGAVAVFITTVLSLSGLVSAGLAGLCITSAMSFTDGIYWACRGWTSMELDLNSVERVVEYLDLPQEPPAIIESNRPPAYWPSSSSSTPLLEVENLVIKYAPELPTVLHGVSFALKAKERVGLLGRTGSGKSTLATSILRFVEPDSGRIFIDGIDISTIGVQDLRSRLTFIPQDTTLFSGTLRDNLDPFNEHTDADCLDVLHRVHLITESTQPSAMSSRAPSIHEDQYATASSASATLADSDIKISITLDTQVSAGGINFSQGQRQLIAIARALLRNSSIIILDEATSSIDFATDVKIQRTIRDEFGDSLLLTVAHRLRTVIDYDRLIVLDKGVVAEFDTPWNLIQKESSIFRNMCLQSGTFGELVAAAKTKAEQAQR